MFWGSQENWLCICVLVEQLLLELQFPLFFFCCCFIFVFCLVACLFFSVFGVEIYYFVVNVIGTYGNDSLKDFCKGSLNGCVILVTHPGCDLKGWSQYL